MSLSCFSVAAKPSRTIQWSSKAKRTGGQLNVLALADSKTLMAVWEMLSLNWFLFKSLQLPERFDTAILPSA